MQFRKVAEYFSHIEKESSRVAITKILSQMLTQATAQEAKIICNLALGQLHPPYIGTQFGIAEKMMLQVVARVGNKSVEKIYHQAKEAGDISLLFDSYFHAASSTITLKEVYHALIEIEEMSGNGSQELKIDALTRLLQKLDSLAAKYVVRIVLGKLRLGFSDMTLVDALSWMIAGDKSLRSIIEHAYNTCADLGLIAYTAKEEGVEGLKKMKIHVGIPIIPAAAERLPNAQAIIDKIGHCVAQLKLDGFRLQIHIQRKGNTTHVNFYSRNLQDMSGMFPDLATECKKFPVESLICEGEALVYEEDTDSFLPFQETVKRKRKHGIEETAKDLPLKLFLFDILYINGKECLSFTHAQRRQLLEALMAEVSSDQITLIEEKKITSTKELEQYFHHAIETGLEGLVVKRENAAYQPGKRNFNWIKLKRYHASHLEDTIDGVIVGYYRGRGKRASFGIGAFLLAVYNKTHDRFETIAKVGTGLKDEQWKELKAQCDKYALIHPPKNVVVAPLLEPDVWISPEIVCAVRAEEITVSPSHTAGATAHRLGYALRFPRFVTYRPDKSPTHATTVKEIEHLFKDQRVTKD